jgi:uncharacterized protein (DUF697 family)/GTP-binding protein EngB required for normal cell division
MDSVTITTLDVMTLLLACDDEGLETLAKPLRRIAPAFSLDREIRRCGPRLSRCPDIVGEFIAGVAAALPRSYGEDQADIAAAALQAAGVRLEDDVSLGDLDIQVLDIIGARPTRSDMQDLALALALLRRPLLRRAQRVGLSIAPRHMLLARPRDDRPTGQGMLPLAEIWKAIERTVGGLPMLDEFLSKATEEQIKMGKVNILIAGKTGAGKSTLVNAVFNEAVTQTGAGRPVTQEIKWWEPEGLPLRLCDTKGLELAAYERTLADLDGEIRRRASSGRLEDRVHVLWLCLQEPGARVEEGEIRLAQLCGRHNIPVIVVLTKAIGPKSFGAEVRKELPGAASIVRVLAEEWDGEPPRGPFGLAELIRATDALLPEATKNAFDAVQKVLLDGKRARAVNAIRAASAAAGLAATTPIPVADAAAVLSVNVGMMVGITAIMGVQMSRENLLPLAGSMLGAMTAASGGRLIAGELLKLVPGIPWLVGSAITSAIAASATLGLGHGYMEFLCYFHDKEQRMPSGEEISRGLREYYETTKHEAPVRGP